MSELVLSGLIVGLIAMLLWTPYLMSKGVSSFAGNIGIGEKIICAFPVINLIRAEFKYHGKIWLCGISSITLILGVAFRVLCWWNFYNNITLGTASIIVFWITIAFYLLSNMVFVYTVINDARAVKGLKLLLLSVAYPFGQYYVGVYLGNVIKHMKEQEDTFKR